MIGILVATLALAVSLQFQLVEVEGPFRDEVVIVSPEPLPWEGPYRVLIFTGPYQPGQRLDVSWTIRNLSSDYMLVAIVGAVTPTRPEEVVTTLWDGPAHETGHASWTVPDSRSYDVLFENRNSNATNPYSWNHSIDLAYEITLITTVDLTPIRILSAALLGVGAGVVVATRIRKRRE